MAKNYFNRYVWLIDTINRHGHITFPEISRLWENSALNEDGAPLAERTFHNHRRAIEDLFGIEIKSDRSLGYSLAQEEGSDGEGLRQWLFESFSLNNLLNECEGLRNRILLENIPSSQHWLPTIINAMKDERAIEMTSQGFSHPEFHTFIAHPYCVKLFRQRWYVLAKSEQHIEPRVYSLDRILKVELSNKKLRVPSKFEARAFFANYFGIIVGDHVKPSIVEVKVDAVQVPYFDSLPLHSSQEAISRTPEYTVYRYLIVPTFDFKQEILKRGPTVEVLGPSWFRDEIIEDISEMIVKYSN